MVLGWWRIAALILGSVTTAAYSFCLAANAQAIAAASPEQPIVAATASADAASPRTRFVVGLDRATQFQVFSLTRPNRVIVDLPEVQLQLPSLPEESSAALVKSFRGGVSAPGQSRIVIDVTVPVVVESAKIESSKDGKTHRLALEIVPVDATARPKKVFKEQPFGLGAIGLQPPLPRPAVRPALRAAKDYKPVIVIDPGHGGHDTGAQKHGTVEKDVVLAFAKALKRKLEGSGQYKVLMTRDTDTFVELDDRRAFGEKHGANLFIAVHADYAKTQARGATIYSLRESVAQALKRSAGKGAVESALKSGPPSIVQRAKSDESAVRGFLADLFEREVSATQDRTSTFTKAVIETMGTSTNLRDDPDKQASFRVLKTAQFPSVLIELAYVSNKEDAELLKSDAWRDKVTESIVTAVGNYFSHDVAQLPM